MKTINYNKIDENLSNNTIVAAYNELCEIESRYDDRLYGMDELDEIYPKSSDLLPRWFHGYRFNPYNSEAREENNPYDDYFFFNGYGNICTVQEYDVTKFCDFSIFEEDNIREVLSQYADEDDFMDGEDDEDENEE